MDLQNSPRRGRIFYCHREYTGLLEAFTRGGLHHKPRWERKKPCLEKRCCSVSVSVGCQKAISEYFSKHRQTHGGNLEIQPRKKRCRKCCQRCERKRAVIDKLETDLQNKNAQLKDLTETVEHLEKGEARWYSRGG